MAALSIDMEFGRNPGILKRQKVDGGIFYVYGIVLGLNDEGGRRIIGDVDLRVGGEILLGQGQIAGIDDHGEVRAAADLVGRVYRVVKTLIEMRAQGGGQVSSGGEPQNADTIRINMPLGG